MDDDDSKEYDNRINKDKDKIQSKIRDSSSSSSTDNTVSIRTEDSYDKSKASTQTNCNITNNRI